VKTYTPELLKYNNKLSSNCSIY